MTSSVRFNSSSTAGYWTGNPSAGARPSIPERGPVGVTHVGLDRAYLHVTPVDTTRGERGQRVGVRVSEISLRLGGD